MDKSATVSKRTYDRFCPLSLALDQVGERWTLRIIMTLTSGIQLQGGDQRFSCVQFVELLV